MSVVDKNTRRPLWLNDQDVSFSGMFNEHRGHEEDNEFRRRTRSAASAYTDRRNRLIQRRQQQQSCSLKKSHLHLNLTRPVSMPGNDTGATPETAPTNIFDIIEPSWNAT